MNDARSGAFAEYWFDKKDINPEKRRKTYLMLNTGDGGSYIDRKISVLASITVMVSLDI